MSTKSAIEFLTTLSPTVLHRLHGDIFTVLTIFRSLPGLGKQYVMRLLYVDKGVEDKIIDSWPSNKLESQFHHERVRGLLIQLHIFVSETTYIGKTMHVNISLSKPFQQSLRTALANRAQIESDYESSAHSSSSLKPITNDALGDYANTAWTKVLNYMVGSSKELADSVKQTLVDMGLMIINSSKKSSITHAGFSFLFKSRHVQVWRFVISIIKRSYGGLRARGPSSRRSNLSIKKEQNISVKQRETDDDGDQVDDQTGDDILKFLFRLSFLKLGFFHQTNTLSTAQINILPELAELGLIYLSPDTSSYCATMLAINLSSTNDSQTMEQTIVQDTSATATSVAPFSMIAPSSILFSASQSTETEFILVETTFRVYAFTSSKFHTTLLELFLRLEYRLPHMLVGTLTKRSVRNAFLQDITSQDILKYLQIHAHKQLKKQKFGQAMVPDNVRIQILLWEAERNRLNAKEGYMIECKDHDDYVKKVNQIRMLEKAKGIVTVVDDVKADSNRIIEKQGYILHLDGQSNIVVITNVAWVELKTLLAEVDDK